MMELREIKTEEDLTGEQDEIFAEYVEMLGKDEASKLHEFFSPTCIPRGLSRSKVKMCLSLLPARQAYIKEYEDEIRREFPTDDTVDQNTRDENILTITERILNSPRLNLPSELISDGSPISSDDFAKGMNKLVDLINPQKD